MGDTSCRAAVIGTGAWGTTLAIMLARQGHQVTLWARSEAEAATLAATRENARFMPGFRFPDSLAVTDSLRQAVHGAELALLVVPSQTMRDNVQRIAPFLDRGAIVVSAAKGFEIGSLLRMSQVLQEELPAPLTERIAVLSGPNLSREVIMGLPAATVIASANLGHARRAQEWLAGQSMRVYLNHDVVGVEIGGALKNIVAIGAGLVDGLNLGDNAKAAFMTRGLAEMARLGVAMGADPATLSGLAGLGDVLATCSSHLSRNWRVGDALAKGRAWPEIKASMGQTAEGVTTTVAVRDLAARYGVEMPITEQIYQVLFEQKDPADAIADLMSRSPRHE